jgi:hypothetical protein
LNHKDHKGHEGEREKIAPGAMLDNDFEQVGKSAKPSELQSIPHKIAKFPDCLVFFVPSWFMYIAL